MMVRRWRLLVAVVSMTMVCALAPQAAADAVSTPGWADGWQQTSYPAIAAERDTAIVMSDGIALRANIFRPAAADGRATDTPLPVLLSMTPYLKQGADPVAGGGMIGLSQELIRSGYVSVVVDVRGTGVSQGVWDVLGPREQADTLEVIEWAARQPWSNGSVGMSGASYLGINTVQAAAHRPPALKAILPVIPGSDLFRDIVGTGGAIGLGFMPMWLSIVNGGKWASGLQAMQQGRFDPRWLADRLAAPATMLPELAAVLASPDLAALPPATVDLAGYSDWYRARQSDPSRIQVPTFVIGGWHDIFANSQPAIYDAIPLPPGQKQLLMGNGYHATATKGFGEPGAPPSVTAFQRAWFDKWLKGIDTGIENYGPVTLYQQGGGWTSGDSFPRAGVDYQRRYLTADPSASAPHAVFDGSLSRTGPAAVDQLTVAPGLRGLCSRQAIEGTAGMVAMLPGGTTCEFDSRFAEAEALTFSTAPAETATVLSGRMNLHLNTVLDATDGFWAVSVNDVAPDGTSTVLSTGQLVAGLRAVDEARSTRTPEGDYLEPYHPLDIAAVAPQTPGAPTVLDIGLLATDAVIQPGHRLRIDVYAFNVPRALPIGASIAAGGLRPQQVRLDPAEPSYLTLPLHGRPGF
ncbi:CocE/NonD family hydrolase [Nocardia sp. NPDC050712]|uniref:CocE/NonD family hydrolase n=1 Tax=Nocardia sp. NPDC050712 TaxID=3155518 RepID=UPI0033EA1087